MNVGLSILCPILTTILMLALAARWKILKIQVFISIITIVLIISVPFGVFYSRVQTWIGLSIVALCQIIIASSIGFLLVMWRFWRDPERISPEADGVILSAADGKVAYVWKIEKNSTIIVSKAGRNYQLDELVGTESKLGAVYVVGVEMNWLDVHVNRSPISGQIMLIKHIDGKFISLVNPEAPFMNERLTTVIKNDSLEVAVVQIASRLVRRIESYLSIGESVSVGQRLGIIKLGSLVAIIIPNKDNVSIEVNPGEFVKAGISVLARY